MQPRMSMLVFDTNHFSKTQLGSQLWFKKREVFPSKVASIVKSTFPHPQASKLVRLISLIKPTFKYYNDLICEN